MPGARPAYSQVVWREEVVTLLHGPSVVEITTAYVVKGPHIVSSAIRQDIS